MTLRNSFIAIIVLIIIISCSHNRLEVDASNIKVNIAYTDMDDMIFNSDSIILMEKHYKFKSEIKDIYDYQVGYCLRIGDVDDTSFYNSIDKYRSDSGIQQLELDIRSHFLDLSNREEIIENGFRHLKYHFPNGKQPTDIIFLNSLFRSGVWCTENEIGVGLEWFLGGSNRIIQELDPQTFFTWMKEGMNDRYFERDVIAGWVETHYLDPAEGRLAEHMIRWGKVLYLTQAAYPSFSPSVILRYSEEDYQWALENEFNYWKYLVDEKLLFKVDEQTTNNMVGEGPFTPGLPGQEGPDRLGQFLGYRMVYNYMCNNEITVEEMLKLSYNDILQAFKI
ncbi:MAG: hypothetical protein QNK85_08490 [Crocinitomicaceae bacterium]|jgi:hypothetical protein